MTRNQFKEYVSSGDFRGLFISEMGWNNYRGQADLPPVVVDDVTYNFQTIAERSGFQILQCVVKTIPTATLCRRIDVKLRRSANDYIAIYIQEGTEHHQWITPIRYVEKRDIVTIEYETAEKADFLYSKIEELSFDLDEKTTIVDVKQRVHSTFAVNSEKITKDFYSGFKKEHDAFVKFITGIDDEIELKKNRNKQWYTSVMLNRLMFCYFIQKKGFLDGNVHYLREKLEWCKEQRGENRFFKSFYLQFLTRLFHDGLNSPQHNSEFEQIYGKIPYLNGGMFDSHQIEMEYANIDIADEAFERLFDFFDKWRWHLDTRISASGKDINPDVLGYIFEQYINDRAQMGAYYTKEDITEYIGRNCILPFLFDKVRRGSQEMERAFSPNGFVWQTLRESGDRYIYDAVKHGYTPDWQTRLPENIARGIDTSTPKLLERRADWNSHTPEEFGLPTEIWRETIERLQRCDMILSKITNGEIKEINDFITYNLDVRNFALDLLEQTDNHHFIAHFYHALQSVTILDPTCGSGAFLFAAMNILEPLYEVCINRMEEFNSHNSELFKTELTEISQKYRSNIQYFIYKSIILRNLYGVDIMAEAVEIAKLRLFLKMVAVVEVDKRAKNLGLDPLPDIDFNIRCGNTLVGYATEDEIIRGSGLDLFTQAEFQDKVETEMQKVAMAYDAFRTIQLSQHEDLLSFKQAKSELKTRLTAFTKLLNQQMFSHVGGSDYQTWLSSHQPFHWIAEYYQIIHGNGGFDVIIGNPPYGAKVAPDVLKYYKNKYLSTISDRQKQLKGTNDTFAICTERSMCLLRNNSQLGFIVPISVISSDSMTSLQHILSCKCSQIRVASFAVRPKPLFENAMVNTAIIQLKKEDSAKTNMYCTRLYRRTSEIDLSSIFKILNYELIDGYYIPGRLLKIGRLLESEIIKKLNKYTKLRFYIDSTGSNIFYRFAGGRYFKVVTLYSNKSSAERALPIRKDYLNIIGASLSSNLAFWYYQMLSDNLNWKNNEIESFPIPQTCNADKELLKDIYIKYLNDIEINANKRESKGDSAYNVSRFKEYKLCKSKPIIDEIDKVLAKHYGFTEEELDFIINYDIKYRMGDELNNEEE